MTEAVKAELLRCQKHLTDAQARVTQALGVLSEAERSDMMRYTYHAMSVAQNHLVEALSGQIGEFCWKCDGTTK